MIPTSQMRQMISTQLKQSPLAEGEVRRIEGMGKLYVSLSREVENSYIHLYTLEIDKTAHHFYTKHNGESSD